MIQSQLSTKELEELEKEFKKYHSIKSIIVAISIADSFSDEDLNFWIKGSRDHTQKALTDMIKIEENKRCQMWQLKEDAMRETYEESPEFIKQFIDLYFWGARRDYNWSQIRDAEHVSKNTVYNWKRGILERYAKKIGVIV